MKNLSKLLLSATFLVGASSCGSSLDEPVVNPVVSDEVQEITVTLEDQFDEVSTRTTSSVNPTNPDALKFSFSTNDTLGIYPSEGGQLVFPLTNASGSSFKFSGGGWGLKTGYTYAAYVPFSKANYDRTNKTIPLNYVGQTQKGINNADHLGAFDYQASAGVTPTSTGASIALKRQSAAVVLKLIMPVAATLKSVTISCTSAIFIKRNNLDISGTEAILSATSANKSKKITLYLDNCTVDANQEFRVYMMVGIPVAVSGKNLYVGIRTSDGKVYAAKLTKYKPTTDVTSWSKNTVYGYSATMKEWTTDPERYIDDLIGSLDQPAVSVPDPGAWN
jgi:hypothetical protein